MRAASTAALLAAALITASAESFYLDKGRGYSPFAYATPEGILVSNTQASPLYDTIACKSGARDFTISFRIDNRHGHPGKRYSYTDESGKELKSRFPSWGFAMTDSCSRRFSLEVSSEENFTEHESSPVTVVTLIAGAREIASGAVPGKKLPFAGESLWKILISDKGMEVFAGYSALDPVLSSPVAPEGLSAFGFFSSPAGEVLASDIAASFTPAIPTYRNWKGTDPLDIILRQSADPMEGYWRMFDRTLDESLLKAGGDYSLALVRDGEGYALIYLSGAKTNAAAWQPGMVKGRLKPTPFEGLFDLIWTDAEGKVLSNSLSAQYDPQGLLTLQFPYQSSVIRLRKTPNLITP